jgi:orotate phosphoribosyltransferase-like protein
MANKVDAAVYKRILELRDQGLTHAVIAQRLGVSERTIRVYIRAAREGNEPYTTTADTLQH